MTEEQVQHGPRQSKILFPVSSLSDRGAEHHAFCGENETRLVQIFNTFCVRELDGNTATAELSCFPGGEPQYETNIQRLFTHFTNKD